MDKENDDFILSDQSGQNLTGKLHNLKFVPDRFGIDCRALEFDGNGYIEIDHASILNLGEMFSLSVWLKLPVENFQWVTLICKGETPIETYNSPAYRVQLTSGTVSYNFPSTREIGEQNLSFPKNQWFHFCFVKNRNELQVYHEGILVYTFYSYNSVESNSETFNIGRDIPGNTEFYKGLMDDLKIYDYALSAKQVKKLAKDVSGKKLPNACETEVPEIPENPWDDIPDNVPEEKEEMVVQDFPDIEVEIPADEEKPNDEPEEEEKEEEAVVQDFPEIEVEIPVENTPDDPYDKLKLGDKINLKGVRFERSKAVFLPDAYPELENLLQTMQKHPTLVIELHGHTDNVGNAYKNKVLSKQRFEKVKDYLVKNGIAENRISTQHFGGDKPIADNSQEVTRKLNRRVEVLIVSK